VTKRGKRGKGSAGNTGNTKRIFKALEAEAKGMSAAFFDIDGTLVAKPSLERRLFWELQRRGRIPARNYLHWLAEILRLGLRTPRDLLAIIQTNKSYLRGVQAEIPSRVNPSHSNSPDPCAGNATSINATSPNANTFSANPSKATSSGAISGVALPGSWLPELFPAAIQRLWWHALRGDAIVLVSGTLAPIAEIVQFALERELLWRGVECKIFSIATQLEIADGCWTGAVAGKPIFSEEKALAVKEFACAQNISLARCSAYGDSSLDRWMLGAVGHAFAVNPRRRLQRIARSSGWPILYWTHSVVRTASEQRAALEQQGLKKSLKLKREAAR
jgi:phosphoserine phosphatase